MTTKIQVHDNANMGNSIFLEFTSEKEAQKFVDTFENIGGSCNFMTDWWTIDDKKSRHALKSSYSLWFIVNACLYGSYDNKYKWVKSIHRDGKLLVLSDKYEYPAKQGIFHNPVYAYQGK